MRVEMWVGFQEMTLVDLFLSPPPRIEKLFIAKNEITLFQGQGDITSFLHIEFQCMKDIFLFYFLKVNFLDMHFATRI